MCDSGDLLCVELDEICVITEVTPFLGAEQLRLEGPRLRRGFDLSSNLTLSRGV